MFPKLLSPFLLINPLQKFVERIVAARSEWIFVLIFLAFFIILLEYDFHVVTALLFGLHGFNVFYKHHFLICELDVWERILALDHTNMRFPSCYKDHTLQQVIAIAPRQILGQELTLLTNSLQNTPLAAAANKELLNRSHFSHFFNGRVCAGDGFLVFENLLPVSNSFEHKDAIISTGGYCTHFSSLCEFLFVFLC